MKFTGVCYRAHDPRWSFAPASGEGAARHGGRFNPVGLPALYLALSLEGAVAEASQGFARKIQPLTLCAYEVDCEDVVDLSTDAQLQGQGFPPEALSASWKLDLAEGRRPASWLLAEGLLGRGASGILVPSFAPDAPVGARNLVLWRWGAALPHLVAVHDPDGRLPRDQSSWAT